MVIPKSNLNQKQGFLTEKPVLSNKSAPFSDIHEKTTGQISLQKCKNTLLDGGSPKSEYMHNMITQRTPNAVRPFFQKMNCFDFP